MAHTECSLIDFQCCAKAPKINEPVFKTGQNRALSSSPPFLAQGAVWQKQHSECVAGVRIIKFYALFWVITGSKAR